MSRYFKAVSATLALLGFLNHFSSLYGLYLMLGLVPCILYRIKLEEGMLLEKFGNEYREYMKKTKKMIPYIY